MPHILTVCLSFLSVLTILGTGFHHILYPIFTSDCRRSTLPVNMLSYLEHYSCNYFLLENVKGLLDHPLMSSKAKDGRSLEGGIKSGVVKLIMRALIALGYGNSFRCQNHDTNSSLATKFAIRSYKQVNMELHKVEVVSSSGEQSVALRSLNSQSQFMLSQEACIESHFQLVVICSHCLGASSQVIITNVHP